MKMAMVKRLFAGGLVLACLLTACSNSELGESTIPESNQTSELASEPDVTQPEETTPSNEALYPLVPDSRTVYPVQDFDSDMYNQPYNIHGNTNENRLNLVGSDYQYGMVARQGNYTYYIQYGAVFRICDGETEAQCLLSPYDKENAVPNSNQGQIFGLSVIGDLIYYVNNSGNILYQFSMKEDAPPQPIMYANFYAVMEETIFAMDTGREGCLVSFPVNHPENMQVLDEGVFWAMTFDREEMYYIYHDENDMSHVKCMNLDGSKQRTVYTGNVTELRNIVDSWLYIELEERIDESIRRSLIRFHTETQEQETIFSDLDGIIYSVSSDGTIIYRETLNGELSICFMDPQSKNSTLLAIVDEMPIGLCLSDGFLYAGDGRNGTTMIRYELKKDGGITTPYFNWTELTSTWKDYEEYGIQSEVDL